MVGGGSGKKIHNERIRAFLGAKGAQYIFFWPSTFIRWGEMGWGKKKGRLDER